MPLFSTIQARPLALGALLALGVAGAQAATPATALALPDLLARLPNAPAWLQADLALQAAQRNLEAARAASGLTLGVGGSLSATTSSGTSSLSSGLNVTAGAGVLPWTGTQDAIRAAERDLVTARAQQAASRASLRLTVQQQYFAARLAQINLDLAQQTVELRTALVAAANAQRALGAASQETVLTRTADLQTAQTALDSARQTLQQATFALAATLGTPLSGVTFSTAPADPGDGGDLNALITQALAGRSSIVAADQTLQAAQDSLGIAQRDRSFPNLSATLRYGQAGSSDAGSSVSGSLNLKTGALSASLNPAFSGNTGTNALSVGVTASFNLLDPAADARISGARTQLSSAQLNLSLARQNAELDVRQKYASLAGARGALASAQTRVQGAQTALDTANAQLAAGSATPTDVLSATVNLRTAQRDLESALETAQLAAAALQTSILSAGASAGSAP